MDAHFNIADFALWFVAFLASLTCHEAAHAFAGRRGGDETAREQVTLNPIPHIRREPFGMVVMPLLSYALAGWMMGWASAPYDPHWARRHPRRAAVMAAAGPAANFLLAALGVVAVRGLLASGADSGPLLRFFWILAFLNGLLGVFNLIPLPPLDGASVLEGLAGGPIPAAIQKLRETPMIGFIGLLVAWKVFGYLAPAIAGVLQRLATSGA